MAKARHYFLGAGCLLVLLATAILVQFAPRIIQRSGDRELLQTSPVPAEVETGWRCDQLALAALPLAALALGLLLPPLRFGQWATALSAVAAWVAWLCLLCRG